MAEKNWPWKLDRYTQLVRSGGLTYNEERWLNKDNEEPGPLGKNLSIPKNVVYFNDECIAIQVDMYSLSGNVAKLKKYQENSGNLDKNLPIGSYTPVVTCELTSREFWEKQPHGISEGSRIITAAENIISLSGKGRATRAVNRNILSRVWDLFRGEPIMIAHDKVKNRSTAYYENKNKPKPSVK